MSADHNKYKALYLISQKMPAKEIASQVGISYATVLRYRGEYEDAELNGHLQELLNFPSAVLEDVLELASERAVVPIEGELDNIRTGLVGLQRLETDLQLTASALSNKIRSMAMGSDSAGELHDLTDSLCNLQRAFFGKDTNILVQQQNNIGQPQAADAEFAYGGLLNDKPKDF